MITIHGTMTGLLVDLAVAGARVRLNEPIPAKGDAMLVWDGHEAFGTIIWIDGCECGVLFDEPLPEVILLKMREAEAVPDEREQVRKAAAAFVGGRPGFSPEPRARVPFGRR